MIPWASFVYNLPSPTLWNLQVPECIIPVVYSESKADSLIYIIPEGITEYA